MSPPKRAPTTPITIDREIPLTVDEGSIEFETTPTNTPNNTHKIIFTCHHLRYLVASITTRICHNPPYIL